MVKSVMVATLVASLMAVSGARADEVSQGLGTLWEVLWHQSGTPTRVVRWEQPIRVQLQGGTPAQREHILDALREVSREAGVGLIDSSDSPDAARSANLRVEVVPDAQLEDNQPCVTYLTFRNETRIESASVQLRSRDAWRCAYHEAMHVMGVRGHPAGKTVLSYFGGATDGLQPLDRVMLRAWYSPRMVGGMTPFEALPVLADTWVRAQPDAAAASKTRDRFYAEVLGQMQAFATGAGDVPAIVRRSGKATDEGVRQGRTEMSFFLGIAYQEGATAPKDPTLAARWYERAAVLGSRPAQARLGAPR